jgi:hypothetical protein
MPQSETARNNLHPDGLDRMVAGALDRFVWQESLTFTKM